MGKHLRKVQAKLNARIKGYTSAVEGRKNGTNGGGGYVDRITAGSYNRPGSMKLGS